MCKIEFKDISTADDMDEFLQTSANGSDMNTMVMYSHYTDIKRALNICSSKTLWLGSYGHMNDIFEKEILDRSNKKGNFFFMSLSRADESLAMYRMYGNRESSVVLQIPASLFVGSIREHLESEYKGGIDDDSRSGSFVRYVDLIDYDNNISHNVAASLSFENVVYCDPYTNSLSIDGLENDKIISPLKNDILAGHIKYKCWDYEKETRFSAWIVDEITKPISRVSISLPNSALNEIKVILGPGFNKERYYNELLELRRLGVLYRNSAYDGFFRDADRAKRFGKMKYYKDYIAKEFSGLDPWGGKLIVNILYCDEDKIEIEWTNEFDDDGEYRKISKRLILDMNDDLISQYDICIKQALSDDKNEYLSYSYAGTIQLIDGKVLISFNSGEYYKYIFGAGGSCVYSESGSCRMGANLLAILQ